jgi:hypothetical protein
MRVISGTEVTVVFSIDAGDQAGAAQPSKNIRRTGRLLAPSAPVSSSALPTRPAAAVVAHCGRGERRSAWHPA